MDVVHVQLSAFSGKNEFWGGVTIKRMDPSELRQLALASGRTVTLNQRSILPFLHCLEGIVLCEYDHCLFCSAFPSETLPAAQKLLTRPKLLHRV